MFKKACFAGYAIGAFNVNNIETMITLTAALTQQLMESPKI